MSRNNLVRHFVSTLVLTLAVSSAIAEMREQTASFLYASPAGWEKVVDNDCSYYYGGEIGEPEDGILSVVEQSIDEIIGADEVNAFYSAAIESMYPDDDKLFVENIRIDGQEARLVVGEAMLGDSSHYVASALILANQRFLSLLMINSSVSPVELYQRMKALSESISVKVEIGSLLNDSPSVGIIYSDGEFSALEYINYQPYSYFDAYHNSKSYEASTVAFSGIVDLIYEEDSMCAVFFNVDGLASQKIMFFVDDGGFASKVRAGDELAIKALAMGDTTVLDFSVKYPLIEPIEIVKIKQ